LENNWSESYFLRFETSRKRTLALRRKRFI